MKVSELGEFNLIKMLKQLVDSESHTHASVLPKLTRGIGDDAAAWQFGSTTEVCTTDTMVSDVHFTTKMFSWRDIGWKAIASNLSDIAAMGCSPNYVMVTLGLIPDTDSEDILEMYQGMLKCCEEYGGQIVGGDVVRSNTFFITVALTGTTSAGLLSRETAQAGDSIAVSGPLGGSAGGLRLYTEQKKVSEKLRQSLKDAFTHPRPRIAEGQVLAQLGVRTAIDISDGLLGDLGKLCEASGVAARLEQDSIPIAKATREVYPEDAFNLALTGGEDYELLFTAPPEVMDQAIKSIRKSTPIIIGTIVSGTPGSIVLVDSLGQNQPIPEGSWDHFR
jgi:thiamine-monophosphate kinase